MYTGEKKFVKNNQKQGVCFGGFAISDLTPELLCGILMLDSTEVFREVFYGKVQLFRVCVCI